MLTSSPSSRLSTVIAIAVICLLGLSLSAVVASQNQSGWGVDYNQFYAASHLAGTGHLYDWEALRKLELENGLEVPTGRLPVVLYGQKILSWLPYKVAFATWVSLCIGALVAFASL